MPQTSGSAAFFTLFYNFFGASGLCKVDQQKSWTRMIPIKAPQLSMQTSRTAGYVLRQKTGGIHPVLQIPHRRSRREETARNLSRGKRRAGKKWQQPEGNILSYELLFVHRSGSGQLHNLIHRNFFPGAKPHF